MSLIRMGNTIIGPEGAVEVPKTSPPPLYPNPLAAQPLKIVKAKKEKPKALTGPQMSHDALAHDLAKYLTSIGRKTWEDLAIEGMGSCRPDVFSIVKTLNPANIWPITHEIKVSRSDFLADTGSEKWKSYLGFSKQVFFACSLGLIKPSEVPEGCGLICRGHTGWAIVKHATKFSEYKLTERMMLKLILGRFGDA